jgi:hypothetical protein
VKFSHRFDTPGCNEVFDEKVEFFDRRLVVTGTCKISNLKMQADLDIEFYEDVIPDESSFEKVPVGRMFVTLAKKT